MTAAPISLDRARDLRTRAEHYRALAQRVERLSYGPELSALLRRMARCCERGVPRAVNDNGSAS